VFTGLSAGEVCRANVNGMSFDLDRCADGLTCSTQTDRCAIAAQLGESCTANDCAAELYCDYSQQTYACQPRRAAGESCSNGEGCLDGLYCRWDDFGKSAMCAPYSQEGQPCGGGADQCDPDLECDWNNYVCRAPGTLGQSCDFVGCEEGLQCDLNSVCSGLPTLGQPCPLGSCADDSWCDTATDPVNPFCAPVAADGEPCTGHNRCASGYCPAGYCLPRPALGEDCTELFVCAAGLACDGATCKPSPTKGPAMCVYDGW
jgi:hypothetical protein